MNHRFSRKEHNRRDLSLPVRLGNYGYLRVLVGDRAYVS